VCRRGAHLAPEWGFLDNAEIHAAVHQYIPGSVLPIITDLLEPRSIARKILRLRNDGLVDAELFEVRAGSCQCDAFQVLDAVVLVQIEDSLCLLGCERSWCFPCVLSLCLRVSPNEWLTDPSCNRLRCFECCFGVSK